MKTVTKVILLVTLITPLPVCGQENPTPSVSLHIAALQGNIDAVGTGSDACCRALSRCG